MTRPGEGAAPEGPAPGGHGTSERPGAPERPAPEHPRPTGPPPHQPPTTPPRTAPLQQPVPERPYGPRPTGWTGGSPTALPGSLTGRPAPQAPAPQAPQAPAPQTPAARPDAATGPTHSAPRPQGVPDRPQPLPPPRPTSPAPGGQAERDASDSAVRAPGPTGAAATVVPGGRTGARPAPPRAPLTAARPVKGRKARLALRRLDPWSVFVTSLLLSLFLAVVTVVAAFVLYGLLSALGIPDAINKGVTDVKGGTDVLTRGRFLGGAALLAAVDVVLLTALATLGSLLYNLVATFTGGLELTLAERD